MTKWKPLNVNRVVKVKLTEGGRRIHRERFDRLMERLPRGAALEYAAPKTDANGYSEFQLWDRMQLYGPHILVGAAPPFDTEILIEV